ncbi:MAG: bacteriohemerythrin [Thermodesulfobacteriota bacterium]
MFFKWTEDLAVNIPEIDEQHKELFLRIDALHCAIFEGKGSIELSALFAFLGDYVTIHFNDEEGIMARHDYPNLSIHKDEHRGFKDRFGRLKQKCELGRAGRDMAIEVDKVVCDWLIRHVCMADKTFAKFLRGRPPDKGQGSRDLDVGVPR